MNYYISDLHLFHKNVLVFDNRPFETLEAMHEHIVEKWNSVITNGDNVYILGDVSLRGKSESLIGLVATLKGKKTLIVGNHDDVSDYRYATLYDEICNYKEITDYIDGKSYKLVLNHYPIFSWNGMQRGDILLYGHTHLSKEDSFFQDCIKSMPEPTKPVKAGTVLRAINVGCMQPYIDYCPRTLKELVDIDNERKGITL